MIKLRRQKKNRDDLTRHIELVNSKNNQHKTVLYSHKPHLYNVVTRVNFITKLLK